MELQTILNWSLGLLGTIASGMAGYAIRSFADLRNADMALTEKVHDLAVIIAGMQQRQEETERFRADVREQLQYIVSRLDKQ